MTTTTTTTQSFFRGARIAPPLAAWMLPAAAFAAQTGPQALSPFFRVLTIVTGPVAILLVSFGLVGGLVSVAFFGGREIGRLLLAFTAGVGLFALDRFVDFIQQVAR